MKIVTIKELCELIGLSMSTLQTQLVHFDRHRIIGKFPFQYRYNSCFLNDLKKYYEQKAQAPRYEVRKLYKNILKNVKRLLNDYKKAS